MPWFRISTALVVMVLVGSLTACGSSAPSTSMSAPTTATPATVRDAALAFQTAMLNNDPAGACSYIDPAAIKAQIAKAGPALAGKDCVALFTTVLAMSRPTGPAKDVVVSVQTASTATVRTTDQSGNVQISAWRREPSGWKLLSTRAVK